MLKRDYEGQNCSVARALEVLGERWTLLVIRDVLLGFHRFDQIQEHLGIARNVLTTRLARLVEEGILEQVAYSESPPRYEYRITDKGRDLDIAFAGLRQWGDKYLSPKPPRVMVRKSNGKPVIAGYVEVGTRVIGPDERELIPGPGFTPPKKPRR
jgi:DNA-binding HxlR family transcriptional regulator